MPTYPNLHFDSLVRHQKMRFSQTKKCPRHPQVVLSNPPTAVGASCTILKIVVFTSIWAPYQCPAPVLIARLENPPGCWYLGGGDFQGWR